MYRNRKKIIGVTVVSVAIFAVFGIATWGIIYASHQVKKDSSVSAKLSGATVYLGNGAFVYGKMSFNDWLIYNMPKVVTVTKNSDSSTTYDYYDSSSTIDKLNTKVASLKINANNTSYSLSTGDTSSSAIDLVDSSVTKSNTGITLNNNYSWDSTLNSNLSLAASGNNFSTTVNGYTLTTSTTTTGDDANATTNSVVLQADSADTPSTTTGDANSATGAVATGTTDASTGTANAAGTTDATGSNTTTGTDASGTANTGDGTSASGTTSTDPNATGSATGTTDPSTGGDADPNPGTTPTPSPTSTSTTVYTTTITSNTGSTIWQRTITVSSNANSPITVKYSSPLLMNGNTDNSLTITYTPQTVSTKEGQPAPTYSSYYTVTYRFSSASTDVQNQQALLTALLSSNSQDTSSIDFSTSKLSTSTNFLYIPSVL